MKGRLGTLPSDRPPSWSNDETRRRLRIEVVRARRLAVTESATAGTSIAAMGSSGLHRRDRRRRRRPQPHQLCSSCTSATWKSVARTNPRSRDCRRAPLLNSASPHRMERPERCASPGREAPHCRQYKPHLPEHRRSMAEQAARARADPPSRGGTTCCRRTSRARATSAAVGIHPMWTVATPRRGRSRWPTSTSVPI